MRKRAGVGIEMIPEGKLACMLDGQCCIATVWYYPPECCVMVAAAAPWRQKEREERGEERGKPQKDANNLVCRVSSSAPLYLVHFLPHLHFDGVLQWL